MIDLLFFGLKIFALFYSAFLLLLTARLSYAVFLGYVDRVRNRAGLAAWQRATVEEAEEWLRMQRKAA